LPPSTRPQSNGPPDAGGPEIDFLTCREDETQLAAERKGWRWRN
jgi:hypothetical protein